MDFDLVVSRQEIKWDRDKLARAALRGMARADFVRELQDEVAARMTDLEERFASDDVDDACAKVQDVVRGVAQRHFEMRDGAMKEPERDAAYEKRERLLRHRVELRAAMQVGEAESIERDLKVLSKTLRSTNRRQHRRA